MPTHEQVITALVDRAESAEAERDRLRAVVEQVEWVYHDAGYCECPWCHNTPEETHKPDCVRQAALSEARQPHTHYCQEHADTWTCNDVTCEAGDVRGCPRKPESEGKNVG